MDTMGVQRWRFAMIVHRGPFTISRNKSITLTCKGIRKGDFQNKMCMFRSFFLICSLDLNFNRCN